MLYRSLILSTALPEFEAYADLRSYMLVVKGWLSSCTEEDGDLRFLSKTFKEGPAFCAPGAVAAGSRFRFADWFESFGSVYYEPLEEASFNKKA